MLTKKEIVSISGVSTAVITAAARAGLLKEELIPRDSPYPLLDPNFKPKEMNSSQSDACKLIRDFQKQAKFSAILLQGVTGSGKTEVYLDAVATALKNGEQVLVLLPEIALTSEFLGGLKIGLVLFQRSGTLELVSPNVGVFGRWLEVVALN